MMQTASLTWGIAALTALGVVVRPFRWPEAIWAVSGAVLLLAFGLIGLDDAADAVTSGMDVYLFLVGMMLLSELARREGLFDWLAAFATSHAKGSPTRLFALVYGVGIVVTVFLSNDATAVVLTPAVYAATKAAKVKDPLPYLLICAFIANAASFVLPISNPANLVVFGDGRMPPLSRWLMTFTIPSIIAIVSTFGLLYWTQRKALAKETIAREVEQPVLTYGAKLAGVGLIGTAILLVCSSALGIDLGLPTFAAGLATMMLIVIVNRMNPTDTLRDVSWGVLPLVAGLFIVVEALDKTGLTQMLSMLPIEASKASIWHATLGGGVATALATNLVNNLPAGLIAGDVVLGAHVPRVVAAAVLIGVDLGPNLSVTGSLATILWLTALRREGLHVGALGFLKIGAVVMIPALLLSLLGLTLVS